MLNDFATIDAQDEISRLAQVTPEEQSEANAFFDNVNSDEPTEEGYALNVRNWNLLEAIHNELSVSPKMAQFHLKEEIMARI